MQEEKQMERRKKIAVELSDLVIYCRPVPFNEDSKDGAAVFFCFAFSQFLYEIFVTVWFVAASRDRDGEGMLPRHVLLPRDKGREVCDAQQRQTLPAVQPPAAFKSVPSRAEAGLVQLRPAAHVALRLPAGCAQLPDTRSGQQSHAEKQFKTNIRFSLDRVSLFTQK